MVSCSLFVDCCLLVVVCCFFLRVARCFLRVVCCVLLCADVLTNDWYCVLLLAVVCCL